MLRLFYVTIFLTAGCHTKIHDKGLLTLQEKKIKLTNIDGKTYHVHAGKDKVYLQQLQGCIVYVEEFLAVESEVLDVITYTIELFL